MNIFADSDFIWSEEHPDRLEYLGNEFRTRYGIDVSSLSRGDIDWNAVAADDIDYAMVRVGYRGYGQRHPEHG